MPDVALDVRNGPPGATLVPAAIQVLGSGPKLYDEVGGQVFLLDLSTLLAPEPDKLGLIVAHDGPSIGAPDKGSPFPTRHLFDFAGHKQFLSMVTLETTRYSCVVCTCDISTSRCL